MELKLLQLKTWFAKAWSFLKLYWFQIVFGLTVAYIFFFVEKKEQMIKVLLAEREKVEASHAATINQLQTDLQREISKREEIQKHYEAMMTSIKNSNDEALAKLAAQREQDIKEMMALFHNDPAKMAAEVSTTFNIPIVHFPLVNPT